ncbi:MAG: aconitate hydratase [Chaenotheca gracillima]|nr:MAG: aconitate hydratase [Chaenotheca gracillima]
MRKFERVYDDVEPVEEYRPGGYHPVHLNDRFNNRYEVIGKLAYGQFSTVWLANDQRLQRHVALKILKADASRESKELAILLYLSNQLPEHPGKKHVLNLLDHFQHEGPNGTHLCLVSPVMISDGQMMTIREQPRQATYVRAVSTQVLLGLDFLHHASIIHCDLQPANIMFSAVNTTSSGVSLEPPEFSVVNWLEGVKVTDAAPRYLMISQRARGVLDCAHFSTLLVKIGDLGGATWSAQCDKLPPTPRALRAPELISQHRWDVGVDIWALGCLIFQLATNEALFPLGTFGCTTEQIDEEHNFLINKILDTEDPMQPRFFAYLNERLPPDFGAKNSQRFASFLRAMLRRDSRERKSTLKLLDHSFLFGVDCNQDT